MGSGSSVLKCPKGYDANEFKKICVLFDKLDKDSNMGVSTDELTSIAELHVKNCKFQLEKRLRAEKADLERRVYEIKEKCLQDIEKVKYETQVAEQSTKQQSTYIQTAIQQKISMYDGLDEDARENVFMKVLMPKDSEHIDFWTFFEYMKTRTDDIKNIEHLT